MKIVVALSLLAAICIVCAQDEDPNDRMNELKEKIKNKVDSVRDALLELDSIRRQVEEETTDEITDEWRKQEITFTDFVTLLVTTMRKEVNSARDKGVDAGHCFDTNYEGVQLIVDQADKDATACKVASYDDIKRILEFIDDVKKRGDILEGDLNSVEVRCHSSNIDETITCLNTELGKIDDNVKDLESDIEQVENLAKTSAAYVILEATKCFERIYDMARFNCKASGKSHTGCVKRELEKAGKNMRISPKIIQ